MLGIETEVVIFSMRRLRDGTFCGYQILLLIRRLVRHHPLQSVWRISASGCW